MKCHTLLLILRVFFFLLGGKLFFWCFYEYFKHHILTCVQTLKNTDKLHGATRWQHSAFRLHGSNIIGNVVVYCSPQ